MGMRRRMPGSRMTPIWCRPKVCESRRSIQPWMGIRKIHWQFSIVMRWLHQGRSDQFQPGQVMFRGCMRLRIIRYVASKLWFAPLCLYTAPNAPSPLNRHAEAFASWPQFGPSGACSWPAKGTIVRRASEIPRFQASKVPTCQRHVVANHLLPGERVLGRHGVLMRTISGSSALLQRSSAPALLGDRAGPGLTGPVLQSGGSLALFVPETRDSRVMVSICLPVHFPNRAELSFPSPIGPAPMPRRFFLGLSVDG